MINDNIVLIIIIAIIGSLVSVMKNPTNKRIATFSVGLGFLFVIMGLIGNVYPTCIYIRIVGALLLLVGLIIFCKKENIWKEKKED